MRLPHWPDRPLGLLIVTPDMHRIHYSVITRETNSNYGFSLPWWDFLFGTYRSSPALGHQNMAIGVAGWRDEKVERLNWMLMLPFVGRIAAIRNRPHDKNLANQTGSPR